MDIDLLKKCGNIDQIAGIREARLLAGRGEGIRTAEFWTAAGLRFTLVPDCGMDLFDFSYKGINFSYQTKNGLTSPQAFSSANGEFTHQWPGGMMVTCGLDNVGGHGTKGGIFPTHGRFAFIPAKNFGTGAHWEGERYVLRATGEVHQSEMYGRHLSIRRTLETDLNGKSVHIHDVITNFEPTDEPVLLLYHINFGYPLLSEASMVDASKADLTPMNSVSADAVHMTGPIDGKGEELYMRTNFGPEAKAMIWNPDLALGAYVRFGTEHLPNLVEWKNMRSHDYVLALEPCNTYNLGRDRSIEENKVFYVPAYSSIENDLTIGVLDGMEEIEAFRAAL